MFMESTRDIPDLFFPSARAAQRNKYVINTSGPRDYRVSRRNVDLDLLWRFSAAEAFEVYVQGGQKKKDIVARGTVKIF